MTNLTPDGNKGDAEKYDDMAPTWGTAAQQSGGGGGGGSTVVDLEVVAFEDVDADGRRDQGEPGLPGVRFFADLDGDGAPDPGEPAGTTGQDGRTLLAVLSGASVPRVIELQPSGFACTTPVPCYYDVDLSVRSGPLVFGNARLAGPGGGGTGRCAPSAGFRSVSLAPRPGGDLRFRFARRVARPVFVDVFQVSQGRTVLGRQRVARFRDRVQSFTWAGRRSGGGTVGDGVFVAAFRIAGPRGTEVRRVAFRRTGGRFAVLPAFQRRPRCRAVKFLRLDLPVFGGRNLRPLRFAYRLNRGARLKVTVRRGGRVVRTLRLGRVERGTVRRGRLRAAGLAPGTYRVKITASAKGRRTHRVVAVAQRL